MAFVVKKQLSLDFLGEGWHAAYITFKLPSLKESLDQSAPSQEEIEADPKKYTLEMVAFLEKQFIDGKGWNGSELVDLQKEDIAALPTIVFAKATEFVSGAVDPNS
ncbi:MAG: hypothetical protein ACREBW_04435 [Candidatus Micrarchaeaceae archaeon]